MSRIDSDPGAREQIRLLGEALAALRRDRGLSQAEAGARFGMTSQGWGLYESGRRAGLFRPDVQRRLTAALDATPEDLALRSAALAPQTPRQDAASLESHGLESHGRAYRADARPARRTLRLADDDLWPWAASGVVVEYEPGLWPRRDQGCVIEMETGEIRVRLYECAEAGVLHLRGGPGLDRTERIERRRVRQVSAILARRET